MDDFDDFLNQLPTPGPPPRVPAPQNMGDDIDALLGEMENLLVPPQQTYQPVQNFSFQTQQTYTSPSNDLDDLLGQLSSPISVPPRTTTTTTTTTITTTSLDDELDELMNLTEPNKAPQVPPQIVPQSIPTDDLDDLMNQLGTPVQSQPKTGLTRQPSGLRMRNAINQQLKATSSPPLQNDDILDQFSAATVNVSPRPPSNRVQTPPTTNELDDLLNQFSSPAPVQNQRPPSSRVVNTPSPSSSVDELDDLMNQLNVNKPQPQPPMNTAPISSPNVRPISRAVPSTQPSSMNELDDLMNQLNVNTPQPQPPRTSFNVQTTSSVTKTVSPGVVDDLDDLMNSLSTPQPSNQFQSPQPRAPQAQYQAPQANYQAPQVNYQAPQSYQSPTIQRTSQVTVQQTRTAPSTASELDDLLSSLETPSVPKVNSITQTQTIQSRTVTPPSSGLDDLDALMAGLNAPTSVPNNRAPVSNQMNRSISPNNYGAPSSPGRGQPPMGGAMPGQFGRGQPPVNNFGPTVSPYGGSPMASPMGSPNPGQFGRGQPPANNFGAPNPTLGRGMPPQQNSPIGGGRGVPPVGRGGGRGGFGADPNQLDQLLGSLSNQMNNIKDIEASKGVCHFCQKYIYAECIQAMGRTYHPDHFVCSSCQKPLGTSSFYETNGEPNCESCYQNMYCPRCAYCNQAIADRCINALNQKWHVNCFVCNSCCQPFPSGSFFERGGMPYCQSCFQGNFSSKCAGCGNLASGQLINALGEKWHPQCFSCAYCRRPFNGLPYFEKEGKPYCEQHYHTNAGSVCAGCRTPIVGRCVDAMGKKWHPEHFVCSYCMNPLSGGGYTEQHGSPYCQECFANLF